MLSHAAARLARVFAMHVHALPRRCPARKGFCVVGFVGGLRPPTKPTTQKLLRSAGGAEQDAIEASVTIIRPSSFPLTVSQILIVSTIVN